jgi:hypothetical protein
MVIKDEALLEVTDTFAAAQGAAQEVVENVKKEIVYEAAHTFLWLGASSILKSL